MSGDVLALLVAIPMAGAVFSLALGIVTQRAGWYLAISASVIHAALSVLVSWRVLTGERLTYAVGGYTPPYGIELVADGLTVIVLLLIGVTVLGTVIYDRSLGPRGNAFYAQLLLLTTGLTGVTVTADMFNLYVFLEITGVAAYTLVASRQSGRAAVAALKYLIVGTVGASFYLVGVAYAFVITGTLNMADLAAKLAEIGYTDPAVATAFALIVVGLAVKIALYPLHSWQPDAYAAAPTTVSAFISALVSTVSAYALARIVYSVFTPAFFLAQPMAHEFILWGGTISVVAGSVLAVTQTDIKRLLAYSSVSHFGLVVAAFGIANETALLGGMIHLVGHGLMKGTLFLAVGALAVTAGGLTVKSFSGLGYRSPVVAGTFAVLALAMVGVPPSVGFVGKWYIAVGAVEAGMWPIAAVVFASTLLTLAYFVRLIQVMYFERHGTDDPAVAMADGGEGADQHVPRSQIVVIVVATSIVVVLGFAGEAVANVLGPTIELLLEETV